MIVNSNLGYKSTARPRLIHIYHEKTFTVRFWMF